MFIWQITAPVYHNMTPNPHPTSAERVPRFCVDSETIFTSPLVSSAPLSVAGKTGCEKRVNRPHHGIGGPSAPSVRSQGFEVLLIRHIAEFDQYRGNVGRPKHPETR